MAQPDKRERIIAAAVRVFAQHGFYTSKVSQVAREAGVADGTIYLYFKSKEDILLSLFVTAMQTGASSPRDSASGSATSSHTTWTEVHAAWIWGRPSTSRST